MEERWLGWRGLVADIYDRLADTKIRVANSGRQVGLSSDWVKEVIDEASKMILEANDLREEEQKSSPIQQNSGVRLP